MFGNKQDKKARLNRIVQQIAASGEVTQRQLADRVGVSDDTIARDLATLSEQGVLLCQKGQKISLFSWARGKRSGTPK